MWVGGDQASAHWQALILPALIPTMALYQVILRRLLLLLLLLLVLCRRFDASPLSLRGKSIIPQLLLPRCWSLLLL